MINEKKINKIIIYKRLGILSFFMSLIPAFIIGTVINFITIIFIIIGSICLLFFRCPYCNHQLNPRLRLSELSYCPKCGHHLIEK